MSDADCGKRIDDDFSDDHVLDHHADVLAGSAGSHGHDGVAGVGECAANCSVASGL